MKSDRITGIVIFIIGAAVCLTSLTYPVGTLQKPGGGFFPLLSSILLLVLCAVFLFQSFTGRGRENHSGTASFFPSQEAPKRIFYGFAALVGYRYLIPVIGFAPATAGFILVLSRFLENYSWKKSVFFSLATAVAVYYLFQVVLKIQMPMPLIKI
jgi:putative tricarboxylic transport membrane protein